MNEILFGKRIYLKPITLDDAQEFVNWRNSPFVKNNFILRKDFTFEQETKWIEFVSSNKDYMQFIIFDNETNEKIGSIYFLNINYYHKKAELGIFLKSFEVSGKGYGTEAITVLLKYGFESFGLNKVFLRVLADNSRAIKTYEKIGFCCEGVAKADVFIENNYKDVVYMAIFNNNFKSNN